MTASAASADAMPPATTVVAGIVVPSTDPVFLGLVAAHVLVALLAVIAGAVAMLSRKGPGRHPAFGRIYYGSLAAAVAFALVLSAMRWPQNLPLAILGVLAFVAAILGRAVRRRRPAWIRAHIASMAASYVLMLTAFYVDNGKNLPLWKALPPIAYWLAPLAVGAPLTIWVMIRHPLARSRAS